MGKLPEPLEVMHLVQNEIITKEEAKDMLFSEDTEEERDKKSLQSEIKFLRELVEKLSKNPDKIVETIRYIEKPYYNWNWYRPYAVWMSGSSITSSGSSSGTATYVATSGNQLATISGSSGVGGNFSSISTF